MGSLPHRRVADAIDFAWTATDIPTVPSLVRAAPAEGMIAQALMGVEGVSVGQWQGINIDSRMLDPLPEVTTELSSPSLGSFRAFLESVPERGSDARHVKWQFTGPVTLGAALARSGLAHDRAFTLALHVVREHVRALESRVADAFGQGTRQIVMLDEPALPHVLDNCVEYGLSRTGIVDLVSGALAATSAAAVNGVHCCGRTDWSALFAMGAGVISVPVPAPGDATEDLAACSRAVSEHYEHGGRIAWGAVRTGGPISVNPERAWKSFIEAMCSLVRAGVDPVALRNHSFVTPECGLANLSEPTARAVMESVRAVSWRVAEQAAANLLSLGS